MVNFSITLHSAPWSYQSVVSACEFAETAIKMGHKVPYIFLYQDGVLNACNTLDISSDELNGQQALVNLHNQYGVKLMLCVTAADKRGINQNNCQKGFVIAGLAEFAELTSSADKLVQFK